MKVAVASSNGISIDVHFGHAEMFYIYELKDNDYILSEIRTTERFCTKSSNHGKNNGVMEKFGALLSDCNTLLCSGIGYHVADSLRDYGIHAYMLECDISTGLNACRENLLDLVMMV